MPGTDQKCPGSSLEHTKGCDVFQWEIMGNHGLTGCNLIQQEITGKPEFTGCDLIQWEWEIMGKPEFMGCDLLQQEIMGNIYISTGIHRGSPIQRWDT